MRLGTFLVCALAGSALVVAACSASSTPTDQSGPGNLGGSAGSAGTNAGKGGGAGTGIALACGYCSATSNAYIPCDGNGQPDVQIVCQQGEICKNGEGCVTCLEGTNVCSGNEVHLCAAGGAIGDLVKTCDGLAGEVCVSGECASGCSIAGDQPSNVGCEFWAVDLDNEPEIEAIGLGKFNAAAAPWAVVLSNVGQATAQVIIEQNDAEPGQPLQLSEVKKVVVQPNSLQGIVMPTRELDGGKAPGDDKAPGTWVSSRAFRIRSTAPIIVYQYNTAENAFSNDASLLLPTTALGTSYRALSWPAVHGNIISGFPAQKGLPDRAYVTVVGAFEDTTVTVTPTYKINAGGPIPETEKGTAITYKLGPFDVLNLETFAGTLGVGQLASAPPVDLSGTAVTSTKPVAVFVGNERAIAPGRVNVPKPPNPNTSEDGKQETCCTDHIEEQLFPLSSLGKNFVVTRSPVRSSGWEEPDILRFVGAGEVATVETNMPAPFNSFTIKPGEVVDTWTQKDVLVKSSAPVMVGQILVSQGWLSNALTGDPSLTIFPALEQFRNNYVILTPPSWTSNFVVIATPVGNAITIDGTATDACLTTYVGALAGVDYESRRCPVGDGVHRINGDKPFGIAAYGYGSAGSYAFIGGADVKKIYEVPEIK